MGPFVKSQNYEYILVVVDYVSKWAEAMTCKKAGSRHSKKMFEEVIFPRFGTPRMVISDGGTHFTDKKFHSYLQAHGIRHNVATPYHPQTSGHVLAFHSIITKDRLKVHPYNSTTKLVDSISGKRKYRNRTVVNVAFTGSIPGIVFSTRNVK